MAKVKSLKTADHSNLKPFGDRVVIRPIVEEKTKGKIDVPDNAKERPSRGTIVAIGPGTIDAPAEGRIGDNVLYSKYSGTEFSNNGEDLLVMAQSEMLTRY